MLHLREEDHTRSETMQALPGKGTDGGDAGQMHASGVPLEGKARRAMPQSLLGVSASTVP
jgi:hypothetical protein